MAGNSQKLSTKTESRIVKSQNAGIILAVNCFSESSHYLLGNNFDLLIHKYTKNQFQNT